MRGVVLAGGLGTRLDPLTRIANKHTLPVYDKPMIYYPIQSLVRAGIRDVLVVTGGNSAGDFLRLLRNGRELGLDRISYAFQEGEGGIAAALALAEGFADREPVVCILGDNILEADLTPYVRRFRHQGQGAKILLKEVEDPTRFGVPVFEVPEPEGSSASHVILARGHFAFHEEKIRAGAGRILRVEEKPEQPLSRYAVIGVYMYDAQVFDIIRGLTPSGRGELEISDVTNEYINRGELSWEIIEGGWYDCGTFESLLRASQFAAGLQHAQRTQNRASVEC